MRAPVAAVTALAAILYGCTAAPSVEPDYDAVHRTPVTAANRALVREVVGGLVDRVVEIEHVTETPTGPQAYAFTLQPLPVVSARGLCILQTFTTWRLPPGSTSGQRMPFGGFLESVQTRYAVVGPLAAIGRDAVDAETARRCGRLRTATGSLLGDAEDIVNPTYDTLTALRHLLRLQAAIDAAREQPLRFSLRCQEVEGECRAMLAGLSVDRVRRIAHDPEVSPCVDPDGGSCRQFLIAPAMRDDRWWWVQLTSDQNEAGLGRIRDVRISLEPRA